MGKGKRFELDTKRQLNQHTGSHVKAHRCDYSGSSTDEAADVMVVWQADRYDDQIPCGHAERFVAYAELKKRSGKEGKRTTVMSGSSQDQSGLEELQELRHELPYWSERVVAIKFPNREMGVFDADLLEDHLRSEEEGWGYETQQHADNAFFDARLTPSDNISMVMPELEYWPSTQAGEPDWRKLALRIGLEPYDFEEE